MSRRKRSEIAIVGMACRFPGADNLVEYWENILAGRDAITDVPSDRWDPEVFHDPSSADCDRVSSRRGGFLRQPIRFDAAAHGVIPNAIDGGEPEQYLVLDAARTALADAGLEPGSLRGRRVEAIIGRGNYFNRGNLTRLQHGRVIAQTLDILRSIHPEWDGATLDSIRAGLRASLPHFGPETIPGQITSATAGLLANRLDLRGASFVVDAASASSLVALDLGVRSLAERRADLVLVGGVYLGCDVDFPMVFCQLGALSRSGVARPFSAEADGTLPGEGVGVVVLKRLSDAQRDGDRIYAVVKGVGLASDGRGVGLTTPSARGHRLAIRRAYRSAGVDPSTIGLIEGHGLGSAAADRAELRALCAEFAEPRIGRRALGAVSSMIGHAMPAAGIAGLIKTALALHHRAVPPTLHAEQPHELLRQPGPRFELPSRWRPWIHGDQLEPRRAGVNAFGFAGISAHAILEEDRGSDQLHSPGALPRWESEAILLGSQDRAGLIGVANALLDWIDRGPDVTLKDLAATLNQSQPPFSVRLGLVVSSVPELAARIREALPRLADLTVTSIRDGRGTYFWERPDGKKPRLAFLFPGEGSQYPRMLADLCLHFPEVRAWFDKSDRLALQMGAPLPSPLLFGDQVEADGLWQGRTAVNLVLTAQWALYLLLIRLGLRPDAVIGHSSGELLALAAAGTLRVDQAFETSLVSLGELFGRLESQGELPPCQLLAVAADRDRVVSIGREVSSAIAVAMDNCPHQVVLAGTAEQIEAVRARLQAHRISSEILPVERAYHTPAFAKVLGPLRAFFAALDFVPPCVPIYSCATAARMPDDPEAIRDLAVSQWTRPVRFREAVEALHADGIGVFVDVGARGNLSGFVEDTLRGRSIYSVAANLPRRSGITQLNHVVASLYAQGIDWTLAPLYSRRRPVPVDFLATPMRTSTALELKVGPPTMTLPAELALQLAMEAAPRAVSGEAMGEPFLLPEASQGLGGLDPRREDAMLDYLRTMNDFLSLQREVVQAYCSAQAPESPGVHRGEAEASSTTHANGNGHATALLERFEVGRESGSMNGAAGEPHWAKPGPWAGQLEAGASSAGWTTRVRLQAEGDPVAANHTLGGRRISTRHPEWLGLPVLPFAVMGEMLAQAAAIGRPGRVLVGLRDVMAHRWVRYEEAPVNLELRCRPAESAAQEVFVSLHNLGTDADPREGESPVFEGVVGFATRRASAEPQPGFALDGVRSSRFTARSLYDEQWLFHGPAFQALTRVGSVSDEGIEGRLTVRPRGALLADPGRADEILSDPIILDAYTHLLGCWGLDVLGEGDVVFPLRMGSLRIQGDDPAEGEELDCRIRVRSVERHKVTADAEIIRPDGSVWMEILGWEDWRFHWPARYRDVFRQPDRTLIGEPLALPGATGDEAGTSIVVWLEPPADMGRPVWRDVLERIQLEPEELASLRRRFRNERSRTLSLWGRIAAKEAARRLWLDRGGDPIYPADLVVDRSPLGAPNLRALVDAGAIPRISIAHTEGVAIALATLDEATRPGIDVERVLERDSGFEAIAFTAPERERLDALTAADRAEWVARFWCAKEAVAKATGLGLVEGPASVEVVRVDEFEGRVGVALGRAMASRCPEMAAGAVLVQTERRGDYVWAWTLGKGYDA